MPVSSNGKKKKKNSVEENGEDALRDFPNTFNHTVTAAVVGNESTPSDSESGAFHRVQLTDDHINSVKSHCRADVTPLFVARKTTLFPGQRVFP